MTAHGDAARDDVGVELRCPACGNDGGLGEVRYLVEVVSSAEVVALRKGAVLELTGPPTRSTRDEPARSWLECRAEVDDGDRLCGRRFEVPAGIRGICWRVGS